jgi:hypothetical protein
VKSVVFAEEKPEEEEEGAEDENEDESEDENEDEDEGEADAGDAEEGGGNNEEQNNDDDEDDSDDSDEEEDERIAQLANMAASTYNAISKHGDGREYKRSATTLLTSRLYTNESEGFETSLMEKQTLRLDNTGTKTCSTPVCTLIAHHAFKPIHPLGPLIIHWSELDQEG